MQSPEYVYPSDIPGQSGNTMNKVVAVNPDSSKFITAAEVTNGNFYPKGLIVTDGSTYYMCVENNYGWNPVNGNWPWIRFIPAVDQ